MRYPKIIAVIPAYNSADFIKKTVTSLLVQNYPFLRSVVIDDCSTDTTFNILQQFFGKIDIVHNDTNKGLSWGLNYALSTVEDEEFMFILEHDIELVDSNYVCMGIRHFNDDRVAIVCGQPIDFSSKRLSLTDRVYARYMNYDFQTNGVLQMNYSYIKADFIRISALKEVGGFSFTGNPKLGIEDQVLAKKMRCHNFIILKDSSLTYRLNFARMRGISGIIKSEINAGRTLGVAISEHAIDISPHGNPESRTKSIHRRLQVLIFGLYLSSFVTILFSKRIALVSLVVVFLIDILSNIRQTRGFFWKDKLYFIYVGIINGIVFPISFIFGLISGIIKKYSI
jgi:glycosyltransferase involved in cell wall biosynthesis